MVPKLEMNIDHENVGFRAVLFRMVPKQDIIPVGEIIGFRAVLFRMVPKLQKG